MKKEDKDEFNNNEEDMDSIIEKLLDDFEEDSDINPTEFDKDSFVYEYNMYIERLHNLKDLNHEIKMINKLRKMTSVTESELNDYQTLLNLGIRIPKMIAYDIEQEIIVKEYIKGEVVSSLIKQNKDISKYIDQLREFLPILYKSNTNIDYYPTNFVVNSINDLIYYIDYECNTYDSKWDFDNWAIKYWNGEEDVN